MSALSALNFDIAGKHRAGKHRAGKHNANADALSRLEHVSVDVLQISQVVDTATDGSTIPAAVRTGLLKAAIATPHEVLLNQQEVVDASSTFPTLSTDTLKQMQDNDEDIHPFLKFWKQQRKPNQEECKKLTKFTLALVTHWDRFVCIDEVLYRQVVDPKLGQLQQLVVPDCLRDVILRNLHDKVRHQGIERTGNLIRSRYYWPKLHKDIVEWTLYSS